MLDRNAIRLAQALYRLWRLRRWERQRRAEKAAAARISAKVGAASSIRVELHTLNGEQAPLHVQDSFLRAARFDRRLPADVREAAKRQYHASRAETCDGVPMSEVLGRQKPVRQLLEENLRAALLPTGLIVQVWDDHPAAAFCVTVLRGNHAARALVAHEAATNQTATFALAKRLFDRLQSVEADADTPVLVALE